MRVFVPNSVTTRSSVSIFAVRPQAGQRPLRVLSAASRSVSTSRTSVVNEILVFLTILWFKIVMIDHKRYSGRRIRKLPKHAGFRNGPNLARTKRECLEFFLSFL